MANMWGRPWRIIHAAERKENYRERRRQDYQYRISERNAEPFPPDDNAPNHWAYKAIIELPDGRMAFWEELTEQEQEEQWAHFRLQTPYFFEWAIEHDDARLVERLIAEGMDVNATTANGTPGLIAAVAAGATEIVKQLLETGARLDIRDEAGKSAVQHVGNNAALRGLLEQAGAVSLRQMSFNLFWNPTQFLTGKEYCKRERLDIFYCQPGSGHVLICEESFMTTLSLPVSDKRDHIRGSIHAPVVLVEYGSFDCPHCKRAQDFLHLIEEKLGDQVCIVYRHFPHNVPSSPSFRAAEAAEAAGTQGAFWDMQETLYEHYDKLDDVNLMLYGRATGMNMDMYEPELNRNVHAAHVQEDFESAVKSGVSSTPTFFINGVRHDDYWDYETLMTAIRSAVPTLKVPD